MITGSCAHMADKSQCSICTIPLDYGYIARRVKEMLSPSLTDFKQIIMICHNCEKQIAAVDAKVEILLSIVVNDDFIDSKRANFCMQCFKTKFDALNYTSLKDLFDDR